MIQLRRSALILLHALLLALSAALAGPGAAHAAPQPVPAKSCRADQLAGATVNATAEFKHRGHDNSMLTSTMDITIPVAWERAADLLLDPRSIEYRDALWCLVGKAKKSETDWGEWRSRPPRVKADEKNFAVHYEAVTWISTLSELRVGPWMLSPQKDKWLIRLMPPPNLAGARWEKVNVRLGGPGALSARPAPVFGEGGTVLTWRHKQPGEDPEATLHLPAAQQWNAVTASPDEQPWELLGVNGASGAFWFIATGLLLLASGARLRRSLIGKPMPQEADSLNTLRSWALLLMLFGLIIHMGDHAARVLSWNPDDVPLPELSALLLLGVFLCFFGRLRTRLLISVCAFSLLLLTLSVNAELFKYSWLPMVGLSGSPGASWVGLVLYVVLLAVCCLGLIASGQRVLFAGGKRFPDWVMVSIAVTISMATSLWMYNAFENSWERISWLLEPDGLFYEGARDQWYDRYFWWFPRATMRQLMNIILFMAPLVVVGVLRVCRAEQYEKGSFTPNQAEKFILISLFVVAGPNVLYFGFSGYLLILLLGLVAVWAVVALGSSTSVLEQLTVDDAPLGKVISRTDRSDVLRLARHFRELQSRLHRLGTANPSDHSATQEVIEAEIDRLDKALPEGVRPTDLPFACGPMATWWSNACRGALVASVVGLPATGLLYWIYTVRSDRWVFIAEGPSGFLAIIASLLRWQVVWGVGGFFLGALWRDLPGRHGPTKACWVTVAFAVPALADYVISRFIGETAPDLVGLIATFASVLTITGFVMDVESFRDERRYWSTNASLVAYVYQMRVASVAFFLAQIVALVTIWKAFKEGGPTGPPPGR
ncbi:DUF6185 family protein [Streptomyces sp. NPDC127106]|uniref:DUF6185 family protein n=1 Tax=Streptomyces sp. NPDC127106 TaxID=3345360 RepID=UPI00363FD4A3